MTRLYKKNQSRYIPYSKRLLAAMMVVTIVVASIIGVALCQIAIYLIHDMESTLVQKNMQIVGRNMSKAMETTDDFAMDITSSQYVRRLCEIDSKDEDSLADLETYLEHQVQQSDKQYGIHASFINVYLKNGVSKALFDKLPYDDYETCVRYYEDSGYITSDKYTPMTWVESVQHQDISGRRINSVVWIRFVYDSITMEKLGVVVGGINESVFKDIFGIFPHVYLCQKNGNILSATDSDMFADSVDIDLLGHVNGASSAIGSQNWEKQKQRICFGRTPTFLLS